jgi:hypothetical protein
MRGWTDRAIELFLKAPDKEAENPHYKCASPMKLYLIRRVEEVERSKEFQGFQNKNRARVESSRKSVETKRERLLREVRGWSIRLGKTEYTSVKENAVRSYNEFKQQVAWEREDSDFHFEPATVNSGEEFLERITVNYLRHQLSDYDEKLERIFGKIGKDEAYTILNQKIYEKIAEVYPQLKSECERQLLRKQEISVPEQH